MIYLSLIHRFKFQLQLMPHRWQTLTLFIKHNVQKQIMTLFVSRPAVVMYNRYLVSHGKIQVQSKRDNKESNGSV